MAWAMDMGFTLVWRTQVPQHRLELDEQSRREHARELNCCPQQVELEPILPLPQTRAAMNYLLWWWKQPSQLRMASVEPYMMYTSEYCAAVGFIEGEPFNPGHLRFERLLRWHKRPFHVVTRPVCRPVPCAVISAEPLPCDSSMRL